MSDSAREMLNQARKEAQDAIDKAHGRLFLLSELQRRFKGWTQDSVKQAQKLVKEAREIDLDG